MLEPVQIIVRGKHNVGKTTIASLIKMFLNENGFSDVVVNDLLPLPHDQKDRFQERFLRNRERQIRINVELIP